MEKEDFAKLCKSCCFVFSYNLFCGWWFIKEWTLYWLSSRDQSWNCFHPRMSICLYIDNSFLTCGSVTPNHCNMTYKLSTTDK